MTIVVYVIWSKWASLMTKELSWWILNWMKKKDAKKHAKTRGIVTGKLDNEKSRLSNIWENKQTCIRRFPTVNVIISKYIGRIQYRLSVSQIEDDLLKNYVYKPCRSRTHVNCIVTNSQFYAYLIRFKSSGNVEMNKNQLLIRYDDNLSRTP